MLSPREANAPQQILKPLVAVQWIETTVHGRQNVNRLLNWNLREPPAPLIRPNSELLIRSSGSL